MPTTNELSHSSSMRRVVIRKPKALTFLESDRFTIFIMIVTAVALFMDDVLAAFCPKSVDIYFNWLQIVVFLVFFCEWIGLCIFKPRYFLSFFFFLDMVSALSILPQIGFVTNIILNDSSAVTTANSLTLTRTARASRAGTRAGRILKAGRILRILRVAKFYKFFIKATSGKDDSKVTLGAQFKAFFARHPKKIAPIDKPFPSGSNMPTTSMAPAQVRWPGDTRPGMTAVVDSSVKKRSTVNIDASQQSRVGAKMSELTTQRLAIIVLAMLFIMPIQFLKDSNDAPQIGLNILISLSMDRNTNATTFANEVSSYMQFPGGHFSQEWNCLLLTVTGTVHTIAFESPAINNYRPTEISSYFISEGNESLFSDRARQQHNAAYSIIQTCFVITLLGIGAAFFSHDAYTLVIVPIERMSNLIEKLRKNPLARKNPVNDADDTQNMETGMLEHTLDKLTAMLQIGFGEAGSAMIQKNITANDELNPMVAGQRMLAIFGFCDIRDFTRINDTLEEDIMLFVNEVAEIVHTEVHKAGGAVNRNLGEAFLLVWRIPEIIPTQIIEEILAKQCEKAEDLLEFGGLTERQISALRDIQQLATQSMAAFIRVICNCTNPSMRFRTLLSNPRLIKVLPNLQVSVGCGLHIGWAIEGAIGSRFKIDASYLSPNVNTTARLMAATKQYNVPLLISGQFWSLLPKTSRSRCRLLDRIAVKGSNMPISIYTFDINTQQVMREKPTQTNTSALISMDKSATARRRSEHHSNALMKRSNADFEKDRLLSSLQVGYVKAFRDNFDSGVKKYMEGDWESATKFLVMALKFLPNDGPSMNLLAFMSAKGGQPPPEWGGFRALQSK